MKFAPGGPRALVRPVLAILAAAVVSGLLLASPASAVIHRITPHHIVSYFPTKSKRVTTFDSFFTNLDYNGGPVMPSNKNYAVYWSPGSPAYPSDYQPGLNRYFTDLAHDSGLPTNVDSIAAQYNDTTGNFARYKSSFGGAIIDTDPYPVSGCTGAPICLTDAQVQTELAKVIAAHGLPRDLTHEYFLLTPPGVEGCFDAAQTACSAGSTISPVYCAYHANSVSSPTFIYANDPYVTGNFGCDDGNHPNGATSDGALQGGLSHEHNESTTDPKPNSAWTDFDTGSSTGFENGDKCGQNFGPRLGTAANGAQFNQAINGHFYWYQQEWSDQLYQCDQRLTFVGPEPVATFTSTPGSGTTMTFNATGSTAPGGVSQYHWQFNDGAGGGSDTLETTSPSVAHTFPSTGKFVVSLTVYAGNGSTIGTSIGSARTIVVGDEGPTAAFSATTSAPYTGSPTTFSGSASADSDGSISSYLWNFGDGATGTGVAPSHTYTVAGTYTVYLTVTDSTGQTATVTHTLTVDEGPVAAFTSLPAAPVIGSPTTFNGTTSSDPDGTIASYSWTFGDGSTGTGATPSHTYATAGTYTVTLKVTDSLGHTASVSHTVVEDEPPTAAFTFVTSGAGASFNGTTSSDPDGTIASYSWTFGDGSTGTGATPSHTYTTAGTYTVTLKVTDSLGHTASVSHTVVEDEPPTAAFTFVTSGAGASFNGTTSSDPDGTIASYSWTFGDGSTGTGATPSHTYATAGTYTVTLKVTDSAGHVASVAHSVTVT